MTLVRIDGPGELRRHCDGVRAAGGRVGLVPTMGYLHEGHLSLVRRAGELSDHVVVSIFVNPTQFGAGEDLARYPVDLEGDLAKCDAAGAHCVFTPPRAAIYPEGYQTYVDVEQLSQGLCGASRPGHFRGVCTVVTKLFNLVGPCVAVFGEKDYQQLQVIRQMVRDLDQPVEVVGGPTVREPDGLAMSSRNAYLDPEQRRRATCLHRGLEAVQRAVGEQGPLPADAALAVVRQHVEAIPGARIDYIEARHARSLQPADRVGDDPTVVAMAVHIGKTRLIDNCVIPPVAEPTENTSGKDRRRGADRA